MIKRRILLTIQFRSTILSINWNYIVRFLQIQSAVNRIKPIESGESVAESRIEWRTFKRNPKWTERGDRFDAIASNPVINQRLSLFSSSSSSFREREREIEHLGHGGTGLGLLCRRTMSRVAPVTWPATSGRSLGSAWWHFLPLPISSSFTWPPFSTDATGDEDRVSGPRVIRSSSSAVFVRWLSQHTRRGEPKLASGSGWKRGTLRFDGSICFILPLNRRFDRKLSRGFSFRTTRTFSSCLHLVLKGEKKKKLVSFHAKNHDENESTRKRPLHPLLPRKSISRRDRTGAGRVVNATLTSSPRTNSPLLQKPSRRKEAIS